jgi:hypothetical protein
MTSRNCLDLAVSCPDVMCPKCNKPYTAWVWKDNLLFTCPGCSEIGFNTNGLDIDENKLPPHAFFTDMEWPCEKNSDPNCTETKHMLFIENYEKLDFLKGQFSGSSSHGNYTDMQKLIGQAYEKIIQVIKH